MLDFVLKCKKKKIKNKIILTFIDFTLTFLFFNLLKFFFCKTLFSNFYFNLIQLNFKIPYLSIVCLQIFYY